MTDAHHERVTPRARLGENLDILATAESELEQPALKR
jgi:hypothetical protein